MPYIGEIRMFGGNFPPVGWLFCEGQQLPISENEALYTLLGTMYGGDGQENFNLPNLQSRIPLHFGTGPDNVNYPQSQAAGVEDVTLTTQQIPVHTHAELVANVAATDQDPTDRVLALPVSTQTNLLFWGTDSVAPMSNQAIQPVGGSQPHDNCQPFLCINFIISLYGEFPQQT